MKTLNGELYLKKINSSNDYIYRTVNENNDSIEFNIGWTEPGYFIIEERQVDTPLKRLLFFFNDTKTLAKEYKFLYDCPIGITKYYNREGNLLKEEDNDAPFYFTWQEIIQIVKDKYGVDFFNDTELLSKRISRNAALNRKMYFLSYSGDFALEGIFYGRKVITFEVTGDTGDIVLANNKEGTGSIINPPKGFSYMGFPSKKELKEGKKRKETLEQRIKKRKDIIVKEERTWSPLIGED